MSASKLSKRFSGLLGRSRSQATGNRAVEIDVDNAPPDSPEATAARGVRLFCESGGMSSGGEEVLQLPVIVEATESTPVAAAAAAQQIRKFLSRDFALKPHAQYNAIMLIRILSDNPGPTFSRNFDKAFVRNVKELLRNCKDQSTQLLLRETLDALEANKQLQEGMDGLVAMWRKEKGSQAELTRSTPHPWYAGGQSHSVSRGRSAVHNSGNNNNPQNDAAQSRRGNSTQRLPAPAELANRLEEARNTAKILQQLLQSTPSSEILDNDLIREFSDRCLSAQRSMQSYINSVNPAPDDDTMLTLIETNEQLGLAVSRHQRSLLAARKAAGVPNPQAQATPPESQLSGALSSTTQKAAQVAPSPGTNGASVFTNGASAFAAPIANSTQQPNHASLGSAPTTVHDFAATSHVDGPVEQPGNPFVDPEDANVPATSTSTTVTTPAIPAFAFEPSHYGSSAFLPQQQQQQQQQRSAVQQASTTNHSPSSPSSHNQPNYSRQDTTALESVYAGGSDSPISLQSKRNNAPWMVSSGSGTEGASAVRHNAAEIDDHSEVGRIDHGASGARREAGDGGSAYDVSPVEVGRM